jgi:hypothetical protein
MKILISTNQMSLREAMELSKRQRLRCDGVWHLPWNSKPSPESISPDLWRIVLDGIGTEFRTLELEALNYEDLFTNVRGTTNRKVYGKSIPDSAGMIEWGKAWWPFRTFPNPIFIYSEAPSNGILRREHVIEATKILGQRVITLCRQWQAQDKDLTYDTFMNPDVPEYLKPAGVCCELPASSYEDVRVPDMIDFFIGTLGKPVFLLVPPVNKTESPLKYEQQIKGMMGKLSKHRRFKSPQLYLVLACYTQEVTGVTFVGNSHSIEAALKVAKGY